MRTTRRKARERTRTRHILMIALIGVTAGLAAYSLTSEAVEAAGLPYHWMLALLCILQALGGIGLGWMFKAQRDREARQQFN